MKKIFLLFVLCAVSATLSVTYYVDPAASGANSGASWGDAWQTLQRAVDGTGGTQPATGDTVRCRGTEVNATPLDFDGLSGAIATGNILFVGCNSSGNIDGTKYTWNGNDQADDCITTWTAAYITLEHFNFINAVDDGIATIGANCTLIDVSISSANDNGINAVGSFCFLLRCSVYNNGGIGIGLNASGICMQLCTVYGNGETGINFAAQDNGVVEYCLIYNNGDNYANIDNIDNACRITGNVIDGTGQTGETGIMCETQGEQTVIAFNRITNCALGIDADGAIGWYGWNYFHGNTDDTSRVGAFDEIPIDGASSNLYGTGADDGYIDAANADYNLKAGAVYRRTAISY
jgi:hypothetical protein